MSASRAAVVIPVKAFAEAKVRLAPALDRLERAELARRLAETVVRAAAPLPVAVVCDDTGVADWARTVGAEVIWCPGTGLNGAVQRGVTELADRGIERVIVAHSDLPLADRLDWVADWEGVTLVPDRRDDGTNVACVPASSGFAFAYGPGSFARHCEAAARVGARLRVVRDDRLAWDVDVPADLNFTNAVVDA